MTNESSKEIKIPPTSFCQYFSVISNCNFSSTPISTPLSQFLSFDYGSLVIAPLSFLFINIDVWTVCVYLN
jgi:hypothetical protein